MARYATINDLGCGKEFESGEWVKSTLGTKWPPPDCIVQVETKYSMQTGPASIFWHEEPNIIRFRQLTVVGE